MKTIEMELTLARYFDELQNLIIPNISWGMDTHECDLFILTKSGYGWEVEIKVSKADLFRDKKKRHGHRSKKIKFLYFAIPDYLEDYIDEIPERAGIIIVNSSNQQCSKIRRPQKNGNYKYTFEERFQIARLGALRIWGLKSKILSANQ